MIPLYSFHYDSRDDLYNKLRTSLIIFFIHIFKKKSMNNLGFYVLIIKVLCVTILGEHSIIS